MIHGFNQVHSDLEYLWSTVQSWGVNEGVLGEDSDWSGANKEEERGFADTAYEFTSDDPVDHFVVDNVGDLSTAIVLPVSSNAESSDIIIPLDSIAAEIPSDNT
jgi:hypothetical protein